MLIEIQSEAHAKLQTQETFNREHSQLCIVTYITCSRAIKCHFRRAYICSPKLFIHFLHSEFALTFYSI